jgi:hypothetical protein
MAQWRGLNMRGANHPKWKGGITERRGQERTLIKHAIRAKGKCERCGSIDNLQGHHILYRSHNPLFSISKDNIEVICATCHASEHPKFSAMISRPRFKTGEWHLCEVCETPFYARPSKKDARFCSHNCLHLWLSKLRHQDG